MQFRFMTTRLGHGKLRFLVIACLIVAAAMIALSQYLSSVVYERDIRAEIGETHARLRWMISTHGPAEAREHIQNAVHAAEEAHDRDVLFLSETEGQSGSGNLAMLDRVESWRTLSIPGALFVAGPFERESTKHEVVGLGKTLKNGEYLFVGYDIDEYWREELWRNAAVWLSFLALAGVLLFASVKNVRIGEHQFNRMSTLLAAHGVQTPAKTNVEFATLVESTNLLADKLVQERQIAGEAGSIAAHDLRAPLSRLQMEMVCLGQQISLPQDFADRFSKLVEDIEKLISRFDSAVFLSKVSRRKSPRTGATSDIAVVLQSVVDLFERSQRAKYHCARA
jgi:signal transduction histidine kinase